MLWMSKIPIYITSWKIFKPPEMTITLMAVNQPFPRLLQLCLWFLTASWQLKSERRQGAQAEDSHQSDTLQDEDRGKRGQKSLPIWATVKKKPWKPYTNTVYNLQHNKCQMCFEMEILWLIPHTLSQEMNQGFTFAKHFRLFAEWKLLRSRLLCPYLQCLRHVSGQQQQNVGCRCGWGKARGWPVLDTAGSRQLQLAPKEPLSCTAQPSAKVLAPPGGGPWHSG